MSKGKTLLFVLAAAGAVAVAGPALIDLIRNGRPQEYYSHIPLVPAVSAFVLFRRWKTLSKGAPGSPVLGLGIMAAGAGLFLFDRLGQPGLIAHAELSASSAILLLSGAFMALFGRRAFRKALFPFAFLVFVIPLPLSWMGRIVQALVTGSMGVTHLLFRAFGVPFVQKGAIFYLPDFGIEVARECSGIRSSLALMVTSVLAGQVFLKGPWKKILLVLSVLPVTVLKNGVRIVTLYLLSYFVDYRIIEGGYLHRSGGFIFFGLGLVMLGYILWLLRGPGSSAGEKNT